jgi:hypothetical protein
MNDLLKHSWKQITTLSERLLQLTNEEEWEAVMALGKERHEAITAHFERFPVAAETIAFYQQNLPAFMTTENTLREKTTAAHLQTLEAGLAQQANRRAINFYHLVDNAR